MVLRGTSASPFQDGFGCETVDSGKYMFMFTLHMMIIFYYI